MSATTPSSSPSAAGGHDHGRALGLQDRQVGRQVHAGADDHGHRLGGQPLVLALGPERVVLDRAPVALLAHGARAGHDRVGLGAQVVEHLAVDVTAEAAGGAVQHGLAVQAGHHVQHHVGPALRARASPGPGGRRRPRPRPGRDAGRGAGAARGLSPARPCARSGPGRARRCAGSTETTGPPSRSASRSLGSVIIFMNWQTAARLAGTNVLSGFSCSSGCSMPVSVATMKVSASDSRAWVEHAAGGEHVGVLGVHVAGGHVLHDRRRAAALGVDQELGARVGRAHVGDVGGPDAGVHVALAGPHVHAPAGDLLDVGAQEHVGAEQDLGVGPVLAPDVLDHLDRVRGGAAVVGLGLDLGGGVHVHDHHGARVLGLPGAQLVGGDRVGQRAAGVQVGQQHGLLGREDRWPSRP